MGSGEGDTEYICGAADDLQDGRKIRVTKSNVMTDQQLLYELKRAKDDAIKAHADLSFSLGIYFGYPLCCRMEFCTDIMNGLEPSERNIDGSGFIPCRSHFVRVRLGEIKLSDLIIDRICPTPFQ